MALRKAPAVLGALVLAFLSACTHSEAPIAPVATPGGEGTPSAATSTPPSPANNAIRDWEALAGDHFRESGQALKRISEASEAGDEASVRAGCEELHDTNAIGLQHDLPSPDPELTKQLQQMIDDMNTATHACLRFVLGRQPEDASNYREYLARAVNHLHRAKAILDGLRPG